MYRIIKRKGANSAVKKSFVALLLALSALFTSACTFIELPVDQEQQNALSRHRQGRKTCVPSKRGKMRFRIVVLTLVK